MWLGSLFPLVADVVNGRFTFETLTAPTGNRLHFPAYDKFLKEIDKYWANSISEFFFFFPILELLHEMILLIKHYSTFIISNWRFLNMGSNRATNVGPVGTCRT